MKINDLLTELTEQLRTYITSSRDPYTSDIAKVGRGVHSSTKIKERPYVGIAFEVTPRGLETNSSRTSDVKVSIYGFCEPNNFDDYEEIHTLTDDIVYFLTNDYTYKSLITIGDVEIFEGGLGMNASRFLIPIEITNHKKKNEV